MLSTPGIDQLVSTESVDVVVVEGAAGGTYLDELVQVLLPQSINSSSVAVSITPFPSLVTLEKLVVIHLWSH